MSRLGMQSPLLQAALRRPTTQLLPRCIPTTTSTTKAGAARTFSHLPSLRPSLSSRPSVFRAPSTTPSSLFQPSPSTTTTTCQSATGETLDLVFKSAITAHPAFGATQIRCGPRATMSGASRLVQKRRHGFLSRVKTQKGRNTLTRRRVKGRKRLSA